MVCADDFNILSENMKKRKNLSGAGGEVDLEENSENSNTMRD
jgi:hypothetical protein